MLLRNITGLIKEALISKNKTVILYGARQVGKTTIAKEIAESLNLKTRWVNADQIIFTDVLSSRDLNKIKLLTDGFELLVIDEAQQIPDIGINLKIIHDELKQLKVLVTGSSSFDLSKKVTEPLTGRKIIFKLFPLSFGEIMNHSNAFDATQKIDEMLVYGCYPEVFIQKNIQDKKEVLQEIANSYLFKDILIQNNQVNISTLFNLLKLLAFQIGSEVSVNELSKNLFISRDKVNNYLEILEKAFIIFKLNGFSKNLRKEISKQNKYYFYDNGIRNIVVNNLNSLNLRNDTGQLWENYIISERIKRNEYKRKHTAMYFWRTFTGAELDLVEELDGEITAYEIKYNKEKISPPKTWIETYPEASFKLITINDFLNFVL